MKPKYDCPRCSQQFSRKWNMREHCRTQHSFDPMPNPDPSTHFYPNSPQYKVRTVAQQDSIPGPGTNTTRPSHASEKFLRMMRDCLSIQELGITGSANQMVLDSIGSIDNALNYLTDNFVIVNKSDITGISGHVCSNCLSFQFQFIKDIGIDLTARERHRCLPSMVYEAKKLQNKNAKYEQLWKIEACNTLTNLTNSIFMGNKYVVIDSTLTPGHLANFHAPLIEFDSITPSDWAWMPIATKKVGLMEISLKNFVLCMGGTFALILVHSGVHSGHHLMYIKAEP